MPREPGSASGATVSTSVGVMFFTDQLAGPDLDAMAARLDTMGVDTLWLPELFGREVFSTAGYLLARTSTLQVASGIANVYARDPLAAVQASHGLGELSGGRFVLGLGVSNPGIARARGHGWVSPLAKIDSFLDGMEAAAVKAPAPPAKVPVYLAAHGPRMLELARARCDGANTYLMTCEHTARARAALGRERVLNVVQHCLLWPNGDASGARELARRAVGRYMGLDYYRRVWSELGFDEQDFADGGSDRLVDTLVAWGDAETVRKRLVEQHDAGADEVIVVPLNASGGGREPDWRLLDALTGA